MAFPSSVQHAVNPSFVQARFIQRGIITFGSSVASIRSSTSHHAGRIIAFLLVLFFPTPSLFVQFLLRVRRGIGRGSRRVSVYAGISIIPF